MCRKVGRQRATQLPGLPSSEFAIVMTTATVGVHPVQLIAMNADSATGGRRPPDQANRLGLCVRRSTPTIAIYH